MHTPERDLPADLHELVDQLAENTYNIRARQRLSDPQSTSRSFPPYEELRAGEKQDYRNAASEILKLILSSGYKLERQSDVAADDGIVPQGAKSWGALEVESLKLPAAIGMWQGRDTAEWKRRPDLYRRLGRRVLKLGEPLLAYDILTEALNDAPSDVELRQMLALALARSGAAQRANSMLTQLRAEGHKDEETLGILARTHKDLWTRATNKPERLRRLKLAHDFYYGAYKLNRGYYSGINAATLGLLLGNTDEAHTLAKEVRTACLREIKKLPKNSGERYWPVATLGEAALVLGRLIEAEDWYAEAAEIGKGQFADLSSTRRNARLLLQHLGHEAPRIEDALKVPDIIVFTGHLIDQPGREMPRFPPELEPKVRSAIRRQVRDLAPGFGYASAGCGADILFLETMMNCEAETHVVLPYEKEQFAKDSVAFAGANWMRRFEKVVEEATTVTTASSEKIEEGSMSFEYANLLLYGLADIRARQLETDLIPLAVWDQKPGDGPGGTASAVEHWKKLGLDVGVIDIAKILKRQTVNGANLKKGIAKGSPKKSSAKRAKRDTLPTRIMAMLFADAVNFSKLSEQQIPLFLTHFLGAIGRLISTSPHAPLIKNTWGDGLYFVFDDVRAAGLFALELCELMVKTDWTRKGLPKAINLRIALHAGPVYQCVDPVTEQQNYTGTHVSRAARIEPITPPGQVYASQAFAALAAAQGVKEFTCDYVGQTPLAKGYGTFAMYHVRNTQARK